MNVAYKQYEPTSPSKLKFVGKGTCVAYIPEVRNGMQPHVTLDFGDHQVMLELEAFKKLAEKVLGTKPMSIVPNNVVKLELVKE